MKFFLVSLLFFIFSSSSFADITPHGNWTGWLNWNYDNTPIRCATQMRYKYTPTVFERVSGQLDCDYVAMDMGSRSWTLDQGQILENGQVVGSYEGNQFRWSENYSPTVMIKAELKVESRHIDYREKWFRKSDSMEIYYIEGRLFKNEE